MKPAIFGPKNQVKQGIVLPLNAAFFRRVDLGLNGGFAEEETFDVVEEKILRVGVREVQTVVIDDLCLFLQPTTPARLADLRGDALTEFVRKGREWKRRALLATMCAFDSVSHGYFLPVLSARRGLRKL